jgi:hypothetical protein
MKAVATILIGAALLAGGCGKKEATPTAQATNEASSGNPLTAPVDYLGAVGQAKKHSEKVIDTASISKAIQQFYAMEDRFPKDLQEMVTTHYLQSVPQPPYGMRFEYNPTNGDFKVVKAPDQGQK